MQQPGGTGTPSVSFPGVAATAVGAVAPLPGTTVAHALDLFDTSIEASYVSGGSGCAMDSLVVLADKARVLPSCMKTERLIFIPSKLPKSDSPPNRIATV
jgi:hypothetical protein